MIVVDTHVVIWTVNGDKKLGPRALEMLRKENDRRASAMLFWELAMLGSKKKVLFAPSLELWIDHARTKLSLAEVPVTSAIAKDAGMLGGDVHGDPCDRIMIATARALACPLITSDRKILAFAADGHVEAIDARS